MEIQSFETEIIRCINGELLFSNDKLFVLVVCLNDIQNFPMCFYDVIVELMNIHEKKSNYKSSYLRNHS